MDDMLKVMSAQVTVRPSGHEFTVEGHDTLLQAGLRAGLKLNYGCGNGTCGMCKVRVIAGEVARTQPFDYPLSEAEKAQGYTLACAHTAASSELTLELLEAGGPARHPAAADRDHRARRQRAGARHAAAAPADAAQPPPAFPGRAVGDAGPGHRRRRRCTPRYPIASCPCDDRNLQFFIARDDDDPLAAALFGGGLKPGDAVTVWGPSGDFVLAEGSRPLVFAACDTGFAPVKSLIEHALALDAAPSMSLFWLATRPDGHFLANQCRAWSEALDPFEYALSTHADAAAGASQMAARDARRPVRHRLRLLPRRAARPSSTRCAPSCAPPACRRRSCSGGHSNELLLQSDAGPGAAADADDAGCSGGESFALRVLGQSMAPEFNEGEIIIIEPDGRWRATAPTCSPGMADEWIFRQLCRRGEAWVLHALNPAFDLPTCRWTTCRPCAASSSRRRCPGAACSKRYI